ncbi:hypothetical protein D3C72_1987090 [compost metagenome]
MTPAMRMAGWVSCTTGDTEVLRRPRPTTHMAPTSAPRYAPTPAATITMNTEAAIWAAMAPPTKANNRPRADAPATAPMCPPFASGSATRSPPMG